MRTSSRVGFRIVVPSAAVYMFAGAASPAGAEPTSLVTAGAGAQVTAQADPAAGPTDALLLGLSINFRLNLLRFVGAEIEYAFGTPIDSERTRMAVSALVYPIPLDSFGAYFKAGVSGTDADRLVELADPSTELHAGAGFELRVHDGWVLGAEVLATGQLEYETAANTSEKDTTVRVTGAQVNGLRAAMGLRVYF